MWWLGQGQNAAAVQALVAAFTGLLTTILLVVTWKYVRLTSRLASITAKNLEVAVLPNLIFSIEGTDKPQEVVISIRNAGTQPVYLLQVKSHADFEVDDEIITSEVSDVGQLRKVVLPAGEQAEVTHLYSGVPKPAERHNAVVYVDCADLFGIKRHRFLYQTTTGLTQYYSHPFDYHKVITSISLHRQIRRLLSKK